MSTSGVTITEMNSSSIVAAAMRKIVLAKGQAPDAEDLVNGKEALNNLVAELMTLGMPLWALRTTTITMVADQSSYTLVNPFPLRIQQAWSTISDGTSKQELNPTANYDFNLLPTATVTSGVPSQFTYQPNINYGTLQIWPAPSTAVVADRTLYIRYLAPFDQFVNANDTPFFPREWNNTLIYGLAHLLAPEFGVPLNDRGMLEKQYDKHLEVALGSTPEQASIYFQPDRRDY
jgi:hypothetical protein